MTQEIELVELPGLLEQLATLDGALRTVMTRFVRIESIVNTTRRKQTYLRREHRSGGSRHLDRFFFRFRGAGQTHRLVVRVVRLGAAQARARGSCAGSSSTGNLAGVVGGGGKQLLIIRLDALLLSDQRLHLRGGFFQGCRALLNNLHPAPAAVSFVLQFDLEQGHRRFVVGGIHHHAVLLVEMVQALAAMLHDALQRGERGLALCGFFRRGLLVRFELVAFLDEFRVLKVDLWVH